MQIRKKKINSTFVQRKAPPLNKINKKRENTKRVKISKQTPNFKYCKLNV